MTHIRLLINEDMPDFRSLRQTALADHPEAFGESREEFSRSTVPELQQRLLRNNESGGFSLGAFDGNQGLVGMVNLSVSDSAKSRHRALLWGMYVSPSHRLKKIGHALVTGLLERAQENLTLVQVHLGVATINSGAMRLYAQNGFRIYGTDPRCLWVAGTYYDEYLMVRYLQ